MDGPLRAPDTGDFQVDDPHRSACEIEVRSARPLWVPPSYCPRRGLVSAFRKHTVYVSYGAGLMGRSLSAEKIGRGLRCRDAHVTTALSSSRFGPSRLRGRSTTWI